MHAHSPAHEKDAQREAVRDKDKVGVSKAPHEHVARQVVLKDGQAVIHVGTGLAVGEPVCVGREEREGEEGAASMTHAACDMLKNSALHK